MVCSFCLCTELKYNTPYFLIVAAEIGEGDLPFLKDSDLPTLTPTLGLQLKIRAIRDKGIVSHFV